MQTCVRDASSCPLPPSNASGTVARRHTSAEPGVVCESPPPTTTAGRPCIHWSQGVRRLLRAQSTFEGERAFAKEKHSQQTNRAYPLPKRQAVCLYHVLRLTTMIRKRDMVNASTIQHGFRTPLSSCTPQPHPQTISERRCRSGSEIVNKTLLITTTSLTASASYHR